MLTFKTLIDEKEEIHNEDCNGYCDCNFYRVYTINFKWMCVSFTRTLCIQQKDRINLIRFVKILTYAEIRGVNIIGEDNKKIQINRNERLLYNFMSGVVTLNLNSSRIYNSEIEYDIKNSMITFNLRDNQCCDNCSCGKCQYYGRIINEEKITLQLNEITKSEIIKVFKKLIPFTEEL